jgi:hypothetical protein
MLLLLTQSIHSCCAAAPYQVWGLPFQDQNYYIDTPDEHESPLPPCALQPLLRYRLPPPPPPAQSKLLKLPAMHLELLSVSARKRCQEIYHLNTLLM